MAITTSLVDFAEGVEALLRDRQTELNVAAIFYGDQDRIPVTPTVCLEPVHKERTLQGAQRYTILTFQIVILVYHSVAQDNQVTRKEVDRFGEAIEAVLHEDNTLGGRVINCQVTTLESGYAFKSTTLFRSSRITFEGTSRQNLP
jgi:hypothetical protein